MSRLLLTSAGFENPKIGMEFLKLINNDPSNVKVLFIPTAATSEEALFCVEKSRKELLSVGIKNENIITYNLDYMISYEALKEIGVVYVCGGNTFYLLHKIRESKFDITLKNLIKNGIIYVGASAGSLLAGPNINIPDRSEGNDIGISDFTGLNITDVVIKPHYSEEYKEKIEQVKQKTKYLITTLTDSQALLIIDEDMTVIE